MSPTYCAACAMHNHAHCAGTCACARRAHVPDVETAAAMRRYERPDRHRDPVERLASDWHRKDERGGTPAGPVTVELEPTMPATAGAIGPCPPHVQHETVPAEPGTLFG